MSYSHSEHVIGSPICECFYNKDFIRYHWGITGSGELIIFCPKCETRLSVPTKAMKSIIVIKNYDHDRKNYSNGLKQQKKMEDSKPKFKLLEFKKKEGIPDVEI